MKHESDPSVPPDAESLTASLAPVRAAIRAVEPPVEVNRLVERVAARTGIGIPLTALPRTAVRRQSPERLGQRAIWQQRLALVGAAIALLCAVGVWGSVQRDRNAQSPLRVYTTTVGQQAKLVIPGGAHVILAPQTTLRVSRNASAVTLDLIGEGAFDVAQQSTVPLIVHTQASTVRVLGTVFDVRQYPDEHSARVSVQRGRVAVTRVMPTDTHGTSVLTAGMGARISDSVIVVNANEDVTAAAAWTSGHLVFYRAPVAEMLTTLSRWYGVTFRLTDTTLAAKHVTATLDYSTTSDLLAALSALLDVSATADGPQNRRASVITLRPHPSPASTSSPRPWRHSLTTSEEVGR